jgi:hypothetical protein
MPDRWCLRCRHYESRQPVDDNEPAPEGWLFRDGGGRGVQLPLFYTCTAGNNLACEKWWRDNGERVAPNVEDMPCFQPRPNGVI